MFVYLIEILYPSWDISNSIQTFASARKIQSVALLYGWAVPLCYYIFPFHRLWQNFPSVLKLFSFKGLVEISPLPEISRKSFWVWVALSLWKRQRVNGTQIKSKETYYNPQVSLEGEGVRDVGQGLHWIHQPSHSSFSSREGCSRWYVLMCMCNTFGTG